MKYAQSFALALLGCLGLFGCSSDQDQSQDASSAPSQASDAKADSAPSAASAEGTVSAEVTALRTAVSKLQASPEHTAPNVQVQHILIAFDGSLPGKRVGRDQAQAEQLAAEIFAKINKGESFDALVKAHTDDSYPGKYPMTLAGRRQMVAGFGDVGWRLEVGEVGVAPYAKPSSPYGWHIIKRLQ